MSDEDISLDEKRVFEERRGVALAFVASGIGLARVEISDDQIGRFGLVQRGTANDVAVNAFEGTVAVATADDVLVGDGEGFNQTGFGSAVAVAVSFTDGLVAADADGSLARYDGADWTSIGTVAEPVTAMDGNLVATEDGVHRIKDDHVDALGLDVVRDVAAAGPFAATSEGVHRYVDGEWTTEIEGDANAVATADARDGGRHGRGSIAVVDGTTVERTADGWAGTECPASDVVDVAVGRASYAITGDGTLFVDPPTAKDGAAGWASRSLGLTNVAAIGVLDGIGDDGE